MKRRFRSCKKHISAEEKTQYSLRDKVVVSSIAAFVIFITWFKILTTDDTRPEQPKETAASLLKVLPQDSLGPSHYQRAKLTEEPILPFDERPQITVVIPLKNEGFGNPLEWWDYGSLEDKLEEPLLEYGCGRWDGHETGAGERTIFYVGDNADKMFRAMTPLLNQRKWPERSHLIVNDGKPTLQKWRIPLPLKVVKTDSRAVEK